MNDLNIRQPQFLKQIAGFFNISFHIKLFGLCLIFSQPMALADPLEAGLGALERGHYGTAVRAFLPLAKEDNPEAQTYMGYLYEKGQAKVILSRLIGMKRQESKARTKLSTVLDFSIIPGKASNLIIRLPTSGF